MIISSESCTVTGFVIYCIKVSCAVAGFVLPYCHIVQVLDATAGCCKIDEQCRLSWLYMNIVVAD